MPEDDQQDTGARQEVLAAGNEVIGNVVGAAVGLVVVDSPTPGAGA